MLNRSLFPGYSAWFPGAEWTRDASPLAEKLFGVDGVGTVLLHDTTLTLGRAEGNARGWKDIAAEAGKIIRDCLNSGEPAVTDALREGMPEEETVRKKIQAVLDLEINPGIAAHSGVVSLERVEGNSVYITMGGGCQGCAASTITLRHGIHTAFRRAVPEVGAIYDETDHAAGENPYFTELPAGMSA
jgi:Fe-S cluster biogenesis protein NfuA